MKSAQDLTHHEHIVLKENSHMRLLTIESRHEVSALCFGQSRL